MAAEPSKKILLTLPRAGDYMIAFEHFYRGLGYDMVIPPETSQRTLDSGSKYTPAQACMPFKFTFGNVLEAIENGANVIAMVGGRTGYCRLSFYADMYKKILGDNGFDIQLVPLKLGKDTWKASKRHLPNLKLSTFLRCMAEMLLKMRTLEEIRTQFLLIHPCEASPGASKALDQKLKRELDQAKTILQIWKVLRRVKRDFNNLPTVERPDLITVGYLGEFFMAIDQYATLNIEEFLGTLGVRVLLSDNFTHWFLDSLKWFKTLSEVLPTRKRRVHHLAAPFLNRIIGGHAIDSIGQSIWYSQHQVDGVVHVFPFGCLPETVATSMLPTVSDVAQIPILSLSFDELTGEAGIHTRIEAFVDMIRRRKAARQDNRPAKDPELAAARGD